jgi:uncharacterized protein (DUF58 family)
MNQTYHPLSPDQLLAIPDLELLARTVVEGFMTGLHRSPFTGASIEFAQYRPYVQGDDLRFVDWSLYARTDRLHTKQFHKETNLRCSILLDCSASMRYASEQISKFRYAQMIAACLSMLLFRQNDEMGLIAFDEKLQTFLPPRNNPQHLRRILTDITNAQAQQGTAISSALKQAADTLPHRGLVILISDLLSPVEELLPPIKQLSARRHDVVILQITDLAEQDFPFQKSATFIDPESGRELFVVPDHVREEYHNNRNLHFETIRKECLSAEIDIQEFLTNQPLDYALRYFLHHRNRALLSSSARRSHAAGGGL